MFLFNTRKAVEEVLEKLLTKHIHGSGFNGSWEVTTTKTGFKASINYHALSEHGYYDGWFTVNAFFNHTIELEKINFSSTSNTRRKYINFQKDYFYDTLVYALDKVKAELEDSFDRMLYSL